MGSRRVSPGAGADDCLSVPSSHSAGCVRWCTRWPDVNSQTHETRHSLASLPPRAALRIIISFLNDFYHCDHYFYPTAVGPKSCQKQPGRVKGNAAVIQANRNLPV